MKDTKINISETNLYKIKVAMNCKVQLNWKKIHLMIIKVIQNKIKEVHNLPQRKMIAVIVKIEKRF
jgi:hypothetical protein